MNKDNQDLKGIQTSKEVYKKKLSQLKMSDASLEEIREGEKKINELSVLELQILRDNL